MVATLGKASKGLMAKMTSGTKKAFKESKNLVNRSSKDKNETSEPLIGSSSALSSRISARHDSGSVSDVGSDASLDSEKSKSSLGSYSGNGAKAGAAAAAVIAAPFAAAAAIPIAVGGAIGSGVGAATYGAKRGVEKIADMAKSAYQDMKNKAKPIAKRAKMQAKLANEKLQEKVTDKFLKPRGIGQYFERLGKAMVGKHHKERDIGKEQDKFKASRLDIKSDLAQDRKEIAREDIANARNKLNKFDDGSGVESADISSEKDFVKFATAYTDSENTTKRDELLNALDKKGVASLYKALMTNDPLDYRKLVMDEVLKPNEEGKFNPQLRGDLIERLAEKIVAFDAEKQAEKQAKVDAKEAKKIEKAQKDTGLADAFKADAKPAVAVEPEAAHSGSQPLTEKNLKRHDSANQQNSEKTSIKDKISQGLQSFIAGIGSFFSGLGAKKTTEAKKIEKAQRDTGLADAFKAEAKPEEAVAATSRPLERQNAMPRRSKTEAAAEEIEKAKRDTGNTGLADVIETETFILDEDAISEAKSSAEKDQDFFDALEASDEMLRAGEEAEEAEKRAEMRENTARAAEARRKKASE